MPAGYLIVRGVELNNKNVFLCYSKNFFLHKEIKRGKKFSFVGDYFFTKDLKESVNKFDEYKEWFDYSVKTDNRTIAFYDVLRKYGNFKKKDIFLQYLASEIIKLEETIENLRKENEMLKIRLMEFEKDKTSNNLI